MNKILFFSLLYFAILPVNAEQASQDDLCNLFGNKAELVMLKRQGEYPLSQVLEEQNGYSPNFIAPFRKIVMMAYKEPAYRTKDNKLLAIKKFRNKVELMCFEEN